MTAAATQRAWHTQTTPPYVAHKTFINFVNGLKPGVPSRIDKSIMTSLSGATQGQLIATLRYFDLIEASGKPKDALFELINSEGAERQRLFREIVTRSYRFVFANSLDLEKATRRQIEEVFADQNVGGETRRKALGFFLALSLDAGLKVSPHIKVRNGKLQIGRRRPPIREPKQQPAKSDWLELLLAKFPSFDPDWSDEIKTRWFDSFEKLMERNGSLK
jgi:hypothetical protein